MEMTTTERRIRVLETRLNEVLARLAFAEYALGRASQDAGNGGGGGSTSGGQQFFDAFSTSVITARNVNTLGSGTFKFAYERSAVLAATGDVNDTGLTGYNNTGGTIAIGTFGYVANLNGKWRWFEADCLAGTAPGSI